MLRDSEREAFTRLRHRIEELDHARLAQDRESAPLFSSFEALLPGENALSRALAYMLDPRASHGQDRRFLGQFLDLLVVPKADFRHITTEHETSSARRIDILLRLHGHLIGIENKPWAEEQDKQCSDYCEELERLSPGQWVLVFLTSDGRRPESGGDFGDRIRPLRYDQLVESFPRTKCEKVQAFLDDFTRYVRERVYGETPVSRPGDDKMIDELLQQENIEVTLAILTRATEIRRRIVSLFRDEMLAQVRKDFGESWNAVILTYVRGVKPAQDFDSAYSGLYFFKPAWKGRVSIGFSNQASNARDFTFGVYYWGLERDSGRRIASGQLQEKLNNEFRTTSSGTLHWDWERPLRLLGKPHYKDWYTPTVTRMMALDRDHFARELYPILSRTITIAEPLIDDEVRRA